MTPDLSTLCITLGSSTFQAMICIDRNARGIALVDKEGRLLGTVTDGDIRRAVLARVNLETPVNEVLTHKASLLYPVLVSAPVGTEQAAYCI